MRLLRTLPITFALFTSTKGHWGRTTDYKLTLNHWHKQVPLSYFGGLVAHIKVSPGHEQIAAEMRKDLESRGFNVIETVGDWKRGLSHGAQYLGDQVKMSKSKYAQTQPYIMMVEDDSPVVCNDKDTLFQVLERMVEGIRMDVETVSFRFMRRGDDKGPVIPPDSDHGTVNCFWSEHTNFQPILLRTVDFYRLGMVLEQNPEACNSVHCEALWRIVLSNFSRSPYKHLVWDVDYAEALHIGVPQEDYQKTVEKYNLS